jgi:hypothetical protein
VILAAAGEKSVVVSCLKAGELTFFFFFNGNVSNLLAYQSINIYKMG